MDSTVITAIISILGTAFVGAIGWFLKTKIVDNPVKRKLMQDRLDNIYTPLMTLLRETDGISYIDFNNKLKDIHSNYLSIVPKDLSKWMEENAWKAPIIGEDYKIEERDFIWLHVESNYNWMKKKLGYDYDEDEIINRYLIVFKQNQRRLNTVRLILNSVLLLLCFSGTAMQLFDIDAEIKMGGLALCMLCMGWCIGTGYAALASKWGAI